MPADVECVCACRQAFSSALSSVGGLGEAVAFYMHAKLHKSDGQLSLTTVVMDDIVRWHPRTHLVCCLPHPTPHSVAFFQACILRYLLDRDLFSRLYVLAFARRIADGCDMTSEPEQSAIHAFSVVAPAAMHALAAAATAPACGGPGARAARV